jgi:glycosyltransferase involved in cell wall biosynthesis
MAQLIYSLYRALRPPAFRLVVVDNGSSDGSAELLSAVAAAGLCHLISNPGNRYHGPALNQGVSSLAEAAQRDGEGPAGAVWLLDSDCVVLRPDAPLGGDASRPGLLGQDCRPADATCG